MVGSVPEAESVAGLELDEAVVALGGGVGDPGGQVGLDRVPPLLDGLGQGAQFGQVGVVGDVGEEAVTHRADRGAVGAHTGTAYGQAQEVAQEFLGLPAGVDLSAVGAHVFQGDLQEGVLVGAEVFGVAAQEPAHGVDGVALAGAAAVLLPGQASAQAGEATLGELDDVEAVGDYPCVGQSAVNRGAERGAQVDGDVADAGLPLVGLGAEPLGHRGRVAPLDLVEQAETAEGVDEADVPGVCYQFPLVGVRVLLPDGFSSSGLVDPDRLGAGEVLAQDAGGVVGQAAPGGGPGQAQVASGLGHGAGAVADRGPGRFAQGGGGAHPGGQGRDRLGEGAAGAELFGAVPAGFAPADAHLVATAGHVPGGGGAVVFEPGGDDPAGGAGSGGVVAGGDVDRWSARAVVADVGHAHPLESEQECGCVVGGGIVCVQARGFSFLVASTTTMITKTCGLLAFGVPGPQLPHTA